MPSCDRDEEEEVDSEDGNTQGNLQEPSTEAGESIVTINCFVCHSSLATYGPLGCLHRTLCKRCAMKQATGGKCKKCGELFFQLKKLEY
ncbi:hypothetical protein PCANC_22734 [Puccinia coronata f. sp. avenae]|uniref:RING-type domain-containing protein n=1 Tax=Puccinia coronata f. sp. avenae TaxID=200324 RepID=A0A2N5V0S0_9BASI|nr:hypothetical protein PCANC_22734 [Puccinia coronata f. sp. avenae]PLW43612.1 hypothetical protein PCASD_11439 [Puccinia coronata f. sp. avenae]